MVNTCFDPSDLIVPAFDANAKTSHLSLDVHPSQIRICDFLVTSNGFPFRSREDVVRFAICFGCHALLIGMPSSYVLLESKIDILQGERFERQKDCINDSVSKYVAAGELDNARRIVSIAYEDYRRIPIPYWRELWLSTLIPAVEMLEQHGIRFPWTIAIPKLSRVAL